MSNIYLFKNKLWKEIHDFRYTGTYQQFHLNKGKYFMLCDGGSGGVGTYNRQPIGGRAMGILDLKVDSDMYAAVGGNGTAGTTDVQGIGGWNGGADGGEPCSSGYPYGPGGGGASDVRLNNDQTPIYDYDASVTIPSEYTRLKYIRISGSTDSFFNTEYLPRANTTIETKVNMDNPSSSYWSAWEVIYGAGSDETQGVFSFWTLYDGVYTAALGMGTGNTLSAENDMIYNEDIVITTTSTSATVTGSSRSFTIVSNTPACDVSTPLCLFARSKHDGSYTCISNGLMYYFKIFEDGELIKYYVPVKRNSDNVYGFYEAISQTFLAPYKNQSVPTGMVDPLISYPKSNLSRIIVGAGAGGGSNINDFNGLHSNPMHGAGGGQVGTYASGYPSYITMNHPTQSSGYSFGKGQKPNKVSSYQSYGAEGHGGAGGGWFGGYSDMRSDVGYSCGTGGGGSSYCLTESSWKPTNYEPNSNYYFTDYHLETGVATYPRVIIAEECMGLEKDDVIYAYCVGETEELPVDNKMTLKMECYGGSGGARSKLANGSTGGYASGTIALESSDRLFVTVGGTGHGFNIGPTDYINKLRPTLGFNGGGIPGSKSNTWTNGSGGGGATDIRVCQPITQEPLPLPSSIKYAKILFYERRNDYKNITDGVEYRMFQLSCLDFYNGDDIINVSNINAYVDINGTTAVSYYNSSSETAENVSKLIDHDSATKFCCKWAELVNVIMEFENDIEDITKYSFTLGSDYPGRDPVAWKIYVSDDGVDWILMDNYFNTALSTTRGETTEISKSEFDIKDKPTLHNRCLVAGGGGGEGGIDRYGGNGGGLEGIVASISVSGYTSQRSGPGTQTTSPTGTSYHVNGIDGTFGLGGRGYNASSGGGGAGGGGWYGGSGVQPDGSGDDDCGGCGGSGYVLTESSYKPPCYAVTLPRLYLTDTTLTTGGNVLDKRETMVKITVLESNNLLLLVKDNDGLKGFNTEQNKWVKFANRVPTADDFVSHGIDTFVNDNGLTSEYNVYAKSLSTGTTKVASKLNASVIPNKQTISYTFESAMRPMGSTIDMEYNGSETTVTSKISRRGVGDTANITFDIMVNKTVENTEERLYSAKLNAKSLTASNRYIPPSEPEPVGPRPVPGDPDYVKKYLLKVGTNDTIPVNTFAYLPTYEGIAISAIHSIASKAYNREIYLFLKLTAGSTTFHRFMKYNPATQRSTVIKDFTGSLFDSNYSVGDFEIIDSYVLISPSSEGGVYSLCRYDMNTETLSTLNFPNNYYAIQSYGKIVKLDGYLCAVTTSYGGVIIINVEKLTYDSHFQNKWADAHSLCKGNKYYLITRRSTNKVDVIDANTYSSSTLTLPGSTTSTATFYNGNFYIAQNGYLHIVDENTMTITKTIVMNWSSCGMLYVVGGVVYMTTVDSKRVWMYSLKDDRTYSIYTSQIVYMQAYLLFRPCLCGTDFYVPSWNLLEMSYISKSKYNFGQKYGQYEIIYNEENEDDFEFDERFVDFNDTCAIIHDGVIEYDALIDPGCGDDVRKFHIKKSEYNKIKSMTFTMVIPSNDIDEEEESDNNEQDTI